MTTSSGASGHVAVAAVVDAVNSIEDADVRRTVAAALRERMPWVAWTTRNGRLHMPGNSSGWPDERRP